MFHDTVVRSCFLMQGLSLVVFKREQLEIKSLITVFTLYSNMLQNNYYFCYCNDGKHANNLILCVNDTITPNFA